MSSEMKFLTNRTTLERHIMSDKQDHKSDRLPPAMMQDDRRISRKDLLKFQKITYSFNTRNIYTMRFYQILYVFEQWVYCALETWIDSNEQ